MCETKCLGIERVTLTPWIVTEGQRIARSDKADYATKTSDRD